MSANTIQQPLLLNTDSFTSNCVNKISTSLNNANYFRLPKIEKVCINIGLAKDKFDTKQIQDVENYILKMTNQKPKKTQAKKAIANFKTRTGDVVGIVVTLRGRKALEFILNLVYIALPRSRDFKGVKKDSFSKNFSSYSLGIPNTNIFPAVGFDASVSFGLQVNIVFKTPRPENVLLLESLQFPFKK